MRARDCQERTDPPDREGPGGARSGRCDEKSPRAPAWSRTATSDTGGQVSWLAGQKPLSSPSQSPSGAEVVRPRTDDALAAYSCGHSHGVTPCSLNRLARPIAGAGAADKSLTASRRPTRHACVLRATASLGNQSGLQRLDPTDDAQIQQGRCDLYQHEDQGDQIAGEDLTRRHA